MCELPLQLSKRIQHTWCHKSDNILYTTVIRLWLLNQNTNVRRNIGFCVNKKQTWRTNKQHPFQIPSSCKLLSILFILHSQKEWAAISVHTEKREKWRRIEKPPTIECYRSHSIIIFCKWNQYELVSFHSFPQQMNKWVNIIIILTCMNYNRAFRLLFIHV